MISSEHFPTLASRPGLGNAQEAFFLSVLNSGRKAGGKVCDILLHHGYDFMASGPREAELTLLESRDNIVYESILTVCRVPTSN